MPTLLPVICYRTGSDRLRADGLTSERTLGNVFNSRFGRRRVPLDVSTRNLFGVLSWVFLSGCLLLGVAQNSSLAEDEDKPNAIQAAVEGFDIDPSNFDQWIYGGNLNAQQGQQRIQSQLKLNIEEVDRVCGITEAQKKKLQLAGRGDLKRFNDDVEVVRKEFMLVRRDQEKFNQLWQKISPLQVRVASGIFGTDSLFMKTVQQTLTVEQYAAYQKADWERRRARYFARVDQYLVVLESGLPLKDEQRNALRAFLRDESKIPRRTSQYDFYLVQYSLGTIPEEKLKAIFDAEQWKLMSTQVAQGRGMVQFLQQQKILDGQE